MNTVFKDLIDQGCAVYFDDILIASETWEDHMATIEKVLKRLIEVGLKVKLFKCQWGKNEVAYLGHILSSNGIRPDPEKIKAVMDMQRPKNVCELRSFLGLCNYYRRFVNNYSTIASPLCSLTQKNRVFEWTNEHQESMNQLKTCLTTAPTLSSPDWTLPFILLTDASNVGVGAILSHKQDVEEKVIAYASNKFDHVQRNQGTIQ